ncbi:MAG: 50S ribosomal protein L7 [Oscillospiraceae bacterium]
MGFDAAVQEMNAPKSKAAGIILASDVAENRKGDLLSCREARHTGRPRRFHDGRREEAVGKRTGIFLVLDAGLYGSITRHISE